MRLDLGLGAEPAFPVPLVLARKRGVVVHSRGEVLHAGRRQVLEAVLAQAVVLLEPGRLLVWRPVGLVEVERPGVPVDGHHELLVPVDDGEGGVLGRVRGARRCDEVPACGLRRAEGLVDSELLFVSVTEGAEADDVLESLGKRLVSCSKLVQEAARNNVTNDVSKTSLSFNLL